jgi:hypothetical protein
MFVQVAASVCLSRGRGARYCAAVAVHDAPAITSCWIKETTP